MVGPDIIVVAVVVVTAAALVLTLIADHRHWRAAEWLSKPIASAGFIVVAVLSDALGTPYGLAILAALALSFVGDVALIPRGRAGPFLLGLGAFLLGHLVFALAFAIRGVGASHVIPAGGATVVLGVLVARWLLPHVKGPMRRPVVAYIVVITAMVMLAIGVLGGPSPHPLIPAAATVFWLSDLCVARNRFVAPGFANRLIGLPLYYAAQVMFALTPAIG